MYANVTGKKLPNDSWADRIQNAVGLDPGDLRDWGRHVNEWVGKGWNPRNLQGILETWERGGIGNGKPKPDPTDKSERRAYLNPDYVQPIDVEATT